MNTSETGLEFIRKWERYSQFPYKDGNGHSVGYGHYIRPGEDYSDGLTIEQAEELLSYDVRDAEDDIDRLVKVELNQNQYDAVASFFYNIGSPKIAPSHTLKYLNDGDYNRFADAMLSWNKSGGKVNSYLVDRRKAERKMFLGDV